MDTPPSDAQSNADEAEATYQRLAEDADIMRMLHILRKHGCTPYLLEVTSDETRAAAMKRGLINQSKLFAHHYYLTLQGQVAFWTWEDRIETVLLQNRFVQLLEHVYSA